MNAAPSIQSVAIVGAGFMGSGIAEAVAVAGLPVVLRDVDDPSVERARGRIEKSLERGLDVLYAVCKSIYEEFKRDEYAPPPLMKRMVASGRLGRKSGRGFYEYQ